MSDTDIYKNKQRLPQGKKTQKPRRRRSASNRQFDDSNRKRRSKNSGARRLAHLFRKSENEKAIWYTFVIAMVLMLVVIGVWQYWYLGYVADRDSLLAEDVEQVEQSGTPIEADEVVYGGESATE